LNIETEKPMISRASPGRCYIVARDIQRHDAVGNFCRQMAELIVGTAHDVVLAAENCHPNDRSSMKSIPEVLEIIGPQDIVIFHFSTADPALPIIAELKCPKILYFHSITPWQLFLENDETTARILRSGLAQRPLAASFDILMANSKGSAADLHEGLSPQDRARIRLEDIIVCPPIVPLDRWDQISPKPTTPPMGDRVILYVGRLSPHKGVHHLLDGFMSLAQIDPSVKLVIVGPLSDTKYAEALRGRIASTNPNVGNRIQLLHEIDNGTLRFVYENTSVYASMSAHEGFAVPIVDAMLFDKPLVLRAEKGMEETAGRAAIYVSSPIKEEVAAALATALDDSHSRAELISAGQARLATLRHAADGHLILDAFDSVRQRHRARSF
jgi:glycosyltransferase involved in cell wall biosynthesis